MIETAVALVFAHLVADFLLQTEAMVRGKDQLTYLLLHGLVIFDVTWAALGVAPAWPLLGLIISSHLLIDWMKHRLGGPGFGAFALDQAAHVAVIALGAALWPGAYAAGIWGNPALVAAVPTLLRLPDVMALAAGTIATVIAGGYAVGALMRDITADVPKGLPGGGLLIGRLERSMILLLLLMGQPAGIGFLITAKSILRFGEVTGHDDDANTRRISEYVIIGTLASFAWALAMAWATQATLARLAP